MKDALALALVHFIWQGAALAALAAVLMRVSRVPTVRYAIGVGTMVAMLAAPVITFLALEGRAPVVEPAMTALNRIAAPGTTTPIVIVPDSVPAAGSPKAAGDSSGIRVARMFLPTTWILNVWALGVLMLSLRFAGGWAVAHRLATSALTPVHEDLQMLAASLAARLHVRTAVRVCESASVAVPMMIGWLRPVIVLPPAALAALPLAQLEALLAHELAHIRRHDYLVNLLQTGVETLCFYHPAVWWISRKVRCHREHCCDDIAVGVCDSLTYVTALSSLASLSTPELALSSTGGSLRDRVRRLIDPATHSASPKGAWIAMLPILLVVSFVTPHAWGAQSASPAAATPALVATQAKPAVPARQVKPAPEAVPEPTVKIAVPTQRVRKVRGQDPVVESRPVREREATTAERRVQEVEVTLAQRRLELERRVKLAQTQNALAQVENQLRTQETALARQRELFEKGLATQTSLATAEERVAALRQQLESARTNRALAEEEFVLRQAELAVAQRPRSVTAVVRSDRERTASTFRRMDMLDASAALQPDDQLTIAVSGEPDLPTTFIVGPDGSIRFPFLGSIRVEGSTTAQVQTVIQKLIADKGLGTNPVVTVSAGRRR